MTHPVTLKELARLLNLAPSTVSRALKGHPDISRETRKKVKALAGRMHYRPSAMALGLRNKRFYLIAVILPELTDYFYAAALQGIVQYAYGKGYKILVFESQEQFEREADICLSLRKSGIDGILIAPAKTTTGGAHLEQLKAEGMPLVFFDRILWEVEADRVIEDDYYGACISVNHLIERGCHKIAHLAASQQWLWAQKRQMGYVQSLLDHHLQVDRELIVEYGNLAQIAEIIGILIKQHQIDGIFAVNDESAIQALIAIRQSGFLIPEEVAVCGYGNAPGAEVTYPPLTTIDRNGGQVGRYAVKLLIDRMEGKTSGPTETKLLKNRLIIRDSSLSLGLNEKK